MKLIKPSLGPTPTTGVGPTRSYSRRPEWLKEWIANKSKYVRLECGHKDNIADADKTITLLQTFNESKLYCRECKEFFAITGSLSLLEFFDIPTPEQSDEPPF